MMCRDRTGIATIMSEPSRLTRPLLPHVDAERVPLTRFVLPSFFVCSLVLWIVGPAEVIGRLTQVVGALAVLCAGINLCRVAWYIRAFLHRHQTRLDAVLSRHFPPRSGVPSSCQRQASRMASTRGAMPSAYSGGYAAST